MQKSMVVQSSVVHPLVQEDAAQKNNMAKTSEKMSIPDTYLGIAYPSAYPFQAATLKTPVIIGIISGVERKATNPTLSVCIICTIM